MKPSSYATGKKGKSGIRRVINAFGYSIDGIAAAYRYEAGFPPGFVAERAAGVRSIFLGFRNVPPLAVGYRVFCIGHCRIGQYRH